MSLSMSEKQSVANVLSKEYCKSSKKRKKEILNEFVSLTGYNRSYASRKLRQPLRKPQKQRLCKNSGKRSGKDVPIKRGRKKAYSHEVVEPLRKIWAGLDYACGKRVKAGMPDMLDAMIRFGELNCDEDIKAKLMKMSAATIDRLLSQSRKEFGIAKGRSTTKPDNAFEISDTGQARNRVGRQPSRFY
ncbi:hypothetical protein AGMMS49957_18120 [Synergistales bacterium]|nr:hypothetical protein AGMMS49957_18120 [Synergistales bacterium]